MLPPWQLSAAPFCYLQTTTVIPERSLASSEESFCHCKAKISVCKYFLILNYWEVKKNVISTNSLLVAAQVLSPRVQEPLALGGEQGHPHILLARVGVETLCSRLASNSRQSSCLGLPNARITVKSHHTWLIFFLIL